MRDISQRKAYEDELKQAKIEAERANEAKSRFVAHMSHELRSPLNAVLGAIDLMLDSPLAPEQHDYAQTIRSSGHALLNLIEGATGGRFHPNFDRIGGLKDDLPKGWIDETRQTMVKLRKFCDIIEDLLFGNEIFQSRMRGIGIIPADVAKDYGLSGANLREARFNQAQLPAARFDLADLFQCHFGAAKLNRASFQQADLGYADFSHADLTDADAREAQMFRTRLHQVCTDNARFTDRARAIETDPVRARAEAWTPPPRATA